LMLEQGKVDPRVVEDLLARHAGVKDPRVLAGPAAGADAAVIEAGERCIVAASDPITFTSDEAGWYCVHVNANDVACTGAVPRWFFVTMLFPEEGTEEGDLESAFAAVGRGCREVGAALCGGHTEVTRGIDRPILCGTMIGEVERGKLVHPGAVEEGDVVVLTKGMAVEATAVIAREKRAELLARGWDEETLDACGGYIYRPGISIVREALAAVESVTVHAMHDPTEGGVYAALWELASLCGTGMEIYADRLFCSPETRKLCAAFGIRPERALSSGALLIVVPPGDEDRLVEALAAGGVRAGVVASVTPRRAGVVVVRGEAREKLSYSPRDDIVRLFA